MGEEMQTNAAENSATTPLEKYVPGTGAPNTASPLQSRRTIKLKPLNPITVAGTPTAGAIPAGAVSAPAPAAPPAAASANAGAAPAAAPAMKPVQKTPLVLRPRVAAAKAAPAVPAASAAGAKTISLKPEQIDPPTADGTHEEKASPAADATTHLTRIAETPREKNSEDATIKLKRPVRINPQQPVSPSAPTVAAQVTVPAAAAAPTVSRSPGVQEAAAAAPDPAVPAPAETRLLPRSSADASKMTVKLHVPKIAPADPSKMTVKLSPVTAPDASAAPAEKAKKPTIKLELPKITPAKTAESPAPAPAEPEAAPGAKGEAPAAEPSVSAPVFPLDPAAMETVSSPAEAAASSSESKLPLILTAVACILLLFSVFTTMAHYINLYAHEQKIDAVVPTGVLDHAFKVNGNSEAVARQRKAPAVKPAAPVKSAVPQKKQK